MSRLAILIDGGHLRVLARLAKKQYNPDFVERVAHMCVAGLSAAGGALRICRDLAQPMKRPLR